MNRETILVIVLVLVFGIISGCATGIHGAAKRGDVNQVNSFLAENPEMINAKDEDGLTPLHWAAYDGQKNTAKLLIAKGADVNAKDKDGETPLYMAIMNKSTAVAELLITKGADINAKDKNGNTPLHCAEEKRRKGLVKLLRKHGAK